MQTRRSFLVSGLMSGAVVSGGLGLAGLAAPALWPAAADAAERGRTAVADLDPGSIPKFATAMPLPRVLAPHAVSGTTSYYRVTMKETAAAILPGLPDTTVRTYQGQFPGPVIKARSGRRVVVEQTNSLGLPVSVHLHGAHVPPSSDGGPMDLIQPGASKTYTYPNQQPHANLWFHDHAHHQESEHVYRGLSGFYLLTDETEERLPLPAGEFDVPIALREARFDTAGQLVYAMDDWPNRNVILVNGRPWPYFEVAARRYRLRLFNQSNGRFFDLKLSDGSEFTVVGGDGGLLARPARATVVRLSPGERADIVVDFSRYPVGGKVVLENALGPGPVEHVGQVMRFDITRTAPDDSSVPDTLRTLPEPRAATVNRRFELSMDEDGRPDPRGYINGRTYDPERIDTEIAYGTTEIWTVTNTNRLAPHNFHTHLVMFRVLERNGTPVTDGFESGLKDTVSVLAGETVKLQATFTGYRGTYVYHCHLFDHSAMGMMGTFRVA
ncbi:multicopper oxidase family protein [Streptomyces sp. NPDC001544]|uniref:multicopper oxidase family protein n=1 Tax=Streptomyces sp. NPDC001544 TaxID=3364584 RepID=UPI00369459E6